MTERKDKLVCELEEEIKRLREENRKLEETVQWMHDLIWKLVKERKRTWIAAFADIRYRQVKQIIKIVSYICLYRKLASRADYQHG